MNNELNKNEPADTDWREEFENNYGDKNGMVAIACSTDDVKQFIQSLLDRQKAELEQKHQEEIIEIRCRIQIEKYLQHKQILETRVGYRNNAGDITLVPIIDIIGNIVIIKQLESKLKEAEEL